MKEGSDVRRQSHRPARVRESGMRATDKATAAIEEKSEFDRLLDRLDAGIADEKRKMSALLARLRTRAAA